MEDTKVYSTTTPITVEAFRNRACSLEKSNENFEHPSSIDVKNLRKLLGFTQVNLAKFLGVTFNEKKVVSSTIAKWEANESSSDHRPINYAAWRLMLIAANVVTDYEVKKEVVKYSTGVV